MADNSNILRDLLVKTDPALAIQVNAQWWADQERIRGARVAKYRRYVTGDHDQVTTTQMRELLRLKDNSVDRLNDLNDNYTRIIVDKMAGRIGVEAWETGGDDADAWLQELLDRSNFEALEGAVYRGAIRDGDAYLMIDDKRMILTAEPAYNGHDGVSVIYGEHDQIVWACKMWSVSGQALADLEEEDWDFSELIMAKVYQPDQITTWESRGGILSQRTDEAVNWSAIGRVPVIAFVNQREAFSSYGESEIRPAIPLQDILNRTVHSAVMTTEYTGFLIRYAFGFKLSTMDVIPGSTINVPLTDALGAQVTEPTPEQAEFLKALKVGTLEAGDLSQYVVMLEKWVKEISQSTQTPIYGITNEGSLSGEALKQLEVGLIGKCQRFQAENTDAWRNAITLAHDIQATFNTGLGSPPELPFVGIHWMSPQIREVNDDIAAIVTVYKNAPNLFPDSWYRRKIGGMLGMGADEIARLEDEAANDRDLFMDRFTGANGAIPLV